MSYFSIHLILSCNCILILFKKKKKKKKKKQEKKTVKSDMLNKSSPKIQQCETLSHEFLSCFILKYTYNPPFGIIVRVFGNGLGDWGSIPGQELPKTQKMVLDAFLLNTQYYKVWIKGKWRNPGKVVAPRYSSYWKGTLQVALNYGWPTYLTYIIQLLPLAAIY